MRAVLRDVVQDADAEGYELYFDFFNPFEAHNRSVARCSWRDRRDNPATWFDSSFAPENGIWTWFVDHDTDLPVRVLDERTLNLWQRYRESGSEMTYIEWLENKVAETL